MQMVREAARIYLIFKWLKLTFFFKIFMENKHITNKSKARKGQNGNKIKQYKIRKRKHRRILLIFSNLEYILKREREGDMRV